MTQTEWNTSTDPQQLLAFCGRKATARDLWRFGVVCCRHVWEHMTDERSRVAVDVAERYANDLASEEECGPLALPRMTVSWPPLRPHCLPDSWTTAGWIVPKPPLW